MMMKAINLKALLCALFLFASLAVLNAQKIGYALSGGGARGFAHIGVLKVLEEEGIKPDYIAGSSIGAIIGALSAMGYSAAEIEDLCLAMNWEYLTQDIHLREDLYIGQKRWAPYGNAVFELSDTWVPRLPSSVYVGNRINLELFKLFAPASQVSSFDDLDIPFACNATNLINGKAKSFRSGSLMQALRASMSIPSLVKPFDIDGNIYIDGGVSQNLPGELLHEMGADVVIGCKVNSSLRSSEQLHNLIEVLDQTINIGITRNLNDHLDFIDLLIEPELDDFTATDFKLVPQIIAAGEKSTRDHLDVIKAYYTKLKAEYRDSIRTTEPPSSRFNRQLDTFNIVSVQVHGNKYLSAAKVHEYTELRIGREYSTSEIYKGCRTAWNSQAFSTIYPVLERLTDANYILHVYVKEKERKQLAINLTYNSEDKLSAGVVVELNNSLLKNSKLLTEVKLGGKNELNIDYVKNFGEEWGAYYRIFPYVNEKTFYNYKDHHKTDSVNSLEWGITTGLGVFAKDILIGEFFLYGNQTRLYNEISETPSLPLHTTVSGFGVKGYHESLDDYIFPTKGSRVMAKFNFARNASISDYLYSNLQAKCELYIPLPRYFSLGGSIDFGTHFNESEDIQYDHFIIGGADGFMGYSRNEVSASHYQIVTMGITAKPYKRWLFHMGAQGLRYSEKELWGIEKDWEYCGYVGIGHANSIMPVRLNIAFNEAGKVNSLFSLGYDFDIFKFSRK
ncbi:MAG: patatin-like phospholipase family protein [Candidatus Cloacimonetes bacterium]|nr:patatin-like phospholipase family protein [Candidatus Cloacimonadota bacterium]